MGAASEIDDRSDRDSPNVGAVRKLSEKLHKKLTEVKRSAMIDPQLYRATDVTIRGKGIWWG